MAAHMCFLSVDCVSRIMLSTGEEILMTVLPVTTTY